VAAQSWIGPVLMNWWLKLLQGWGLLQGLC